MDFFDEDNFTPNGAKPALMIEAPMRSLCGETTQLQLIRQPRARRAKFGMSIESVGQPTRFGED